MKMIMSLETLDNGNSTLTFIMPDDNVTLQPVFAKGTNVVDGIEDIANADSQIKSDDIFDLAGRRIAKSSNHSSIKAPKGVYIKNGKKIIIRQ